MPGRIGYLRFADETIGDIFEGNTVEFTKKPSDTQKAILGDASRLSKERFRDFLSDRIFSRYRRDVEKLLFRLGLSEYDEFAIAWKTNALNTKDSFWICSDPSEKYGDKTNFLFKEVFKMSLDAEGGSAHSPDGMNVKNYGIFGGKFGIYKKRLSEVVMDVESEVACFELAKLFGVPCCPAYRTGQDVVFSEFCYDFNREYLVHARRFFAGIARSGDLYADFCGIFPEFVGDFNKMCVFDFLMYQDDRHLSNFAIKIDERNRRYFYELYDNGRSLFYESGEQTVSNACGNIEMYAPPFGEIGSYYDVVCKIKEEYDISSLVNLNVSKDQIFGILKSAGFVGYRLEGGVNWIANCIDVLKS